MTYTQVKTKVLMLLNQYSVAGDLVATSYNNQQDYINRIPSLINDAMMEIATTYRKIPVLYTLDLPEDLGATYRYALPGNFYQFQSGGTVITTQEGHVLHTNLYSMQGRNYLLVPKREIEKGNAYSVIYYRYPDLLDLEKPAGELDNVAETHAAIPYYVASFLVADDSAFLCSLFYNTYEDKLQKMTPDITAEAHPVADVYLSAFGEGYWT